MEYVYKKIAFILTFYAYINYVILCIEKLFRYKMSKKLNKKLFIKLLICNECLQIYLTINYSIKKKYLKITRTDIYIIHILHAFFIY